MDEIEILIYSEPPKRMEPVLCGTGKKGTSVFTEGRGCKASEYACPPGDVVASKDSDFLIYDSVQELWRPCGQGRFWVYDVFEVLKTLHLSWSQMTAAGIVITNDYEKNVPGFGIWTIPTKRDILAANNMNSIMESKSDQSTLSEVLRAQ